LGFLMTTRTRGFLGIGVNAGSSLFILRENGIISIYLYVLNALRGITLIRM
jgi:hypothetical protein